MMDQVLEKHLDQFKKYVAGFYGEDDFINANIQLKEKHSFRVLSEMRYLIRSMSLNPRDTRIAELTALFHDIGRFEQFAKYRTYHDPRSIDHSRFGVEVIEKNKMLTDLDPDERDTILIAIKYHGAKDIPAGLTQNQLFHLKLIRDADKLDIFHLVVKYYKEYAADPESFRLEVELPDKPYYSQAVLDAVQAEELVDYRLLQTWNDMKILQLGWVYDINFPASLNKIREKKYIQQIVGFLPDDPEILKVKEKVLNYMNRRLAENNSK